MGRTPSRDVMDAVGAARALERWGNARAWSGTDPYDALNATRVPRIARDSPLALRVVTQAVKRSPVDLRPVLGIAHGLSAATLAHVISAYARNGFLNEVEAQSKLRECIHRLASLAVLDVHRAGWGYHFDVQTRVFFYPRTTPNTIATAFAGLALLELGVVSPTSPAASDDGFQPLHRATATSWSSAPKRRLEEGSHLDHPSSAK